MSTRRITRLEAQLLGLKSLETEADEKLLIRVTDELVDMRTKAALGVLFARIADREHDIQEVLSDACEAFSPSMYTEAIARELVPLSQRAPYRTSILLLGILQSERHLQPLSAALVGAGPEIQRALGSLLDMAKADRPDVNRAADRLVRAVRARVSLHVSSHKTGRKRRAR